MALVGFKGLVEKGQALLMFATPRGKFGEQIIPRAPHGITPYGTPSIVLRSRHVARRKTAERTLIIGLRMIGILVAQRQAGNRTGKIFLRNRIFSAAQADVSHRLVATCIARVTCKRLFKIILCRVGKMFILFKMNAVDP